MKSRSVQAGKSFIIKQGRGSSVVEQPIRNRQVVGSTPTLGSRFFHESCESSRKLPDTWASSWMDDPEGLQAAARGIEFGEPAAFLLHQVILHTAGAFGCFENVFPVGTAFAE